MLQKLKISVNCLPERALLEVPLWMALNEVAPQDRSTPSREEPPAEHAPASSSHLSSAFEAWNTLNPPKQLHDPKAPVQPTPPSNDVAEYDIWSTLDQVQPPAQIEATHTDQSVPTQTDFSSWSIFDQDDEAVHYETATSASSSQDSSGLDSWNMLD